MCTPKWSNSFARLPAAFYSPVQPTPFRSPARLLHFNESAATLLGLELNAGTVAQSSWLDWLSGRALPAGAEPLAMLYAGHQFGHYVPQLGDGRAIMLGEISHADHGKWELQLKGSGLTPYSRDGDGRAVLRSTIREYLCSEAMHGLGIPTTRALAMIGSDDEVYRERIEPGAMLARLAPSHVRFGSFEVFYYRNQVEHLRTLADFVVAHHYPHLRESANPYLALFTEVMARTARLIAQWQAVGFSHGVMNSDNMSILGLTLDYGPFGFLEAYEPGFICNHSDHHGRYAFDQQPQIGLFNLSCLAQALLPLFDESDGQNVELAVDQARAAMAQYQPAYEKEYAALMRAKLGLRESKDKDADLLQELLDLMQSNQVDYTIAFRTLSEFRDDGSAPSALRNLFRDRDALDAWARHYGQRLQQENSDPAERKLRMNRINPKYILRNYLAEIAIRKAEDEQDYSEIGTLFRLLQTPFDDQPEYDAYAGQPPQWASQISVSCSS